MNTIDALDAAQRQYNRCARMVAIDVDITDAIATDPNAPGERGPRADAWRAQMLAVDLANFRAAAAELDAATRAHFALR
ncbi:hypothetical protein [Microbacterium sp.]|uniref:hypothetical protein n=1 Tax=Microbacterium sp. TaxID=51671 RepID=UPI003A935653